MTTQLSQIRWGRTIWTALTVFGASFLIVFLIITGYATYLAFQARGAPDITLIQEFARQYAPWIGSISLILFTFLGSIWMGSFVRTDLQLHGFVLGLLVTFVNIIFEGASAFSVASLVTTALVIAAGSLGARVRTGNS